MSTSDPEGGRGAETRAIGGSSLEVEVMSRPPSASDLVVGDSDVNVVERGVTHKKRHSEIQKPRIFHREPDETLKTLRSEVETLAPDQQVKKFIAGALRSFSVSPALDGYMFVSDQLGCANIISNATKATKEAEGWVETVLAPMLENWPRLQGTFKLTAASGYQPTTYEAAAKAVEKMWNEQRTSRGGPGFDDHIHLVLLSPRDPDDYIALGGKRLYWLDDDVKSRDFPNGLLHAIDYHKTDATASAPDGMEHRRSEEGASLESYLFRVTRQRTIVADGGDISDIWPLPYRCKERSQLEATRVCLLLNDLRELLHEGSSTIVKAASELSEETLHLRVITRETVTHHLAVAEQHRKDVRLLDEDGKMHRLFKPMDGPAPYGIQYQSMRARAHTYTDVPRRPGRHAAA